MGCFNDPAWESLWVVEWWGGGVADNKYLYPARWGWIKTVTLLIDTRLLFVMMIASLYLLISVCPLAVIFTIPFFVSRKQ